MIVEPSEEVTTNCHNQFFINILTDHNIDLCQSFSATITLSQNMIRRLKNKNGQQSV